MVLKRGAWSLSVWSAQRRWRVGVVAIVRWLVVCVLGWCLRLRFEVMMESGFGVLEGV